MERKKEWDGNTLKIKKRSRNIAKDQEPEWDQEMEMKKKTLEIWLKRNNTKINKRKTKRKTHL